MIQKIVHFITTPVSTSDPRIFDVPTEFINNHFSFPRQDSITGLLSSGNLDAEVDINRAWETIRENIKILAKESLVYYELKKHKPWLDE
jgi:hypothetical protein